MLTVWWYTYCPSTLLAQTPRTAYYAGKPTMNLAQRTSYNVPCFFVVGHLNPTLLVIWITLRNSGNSDMSVISMYIFSKFAKDWVLEVFLKIVLRIVCYWYGDSAYVAEINNEFWKVEPMYPPSQCNPPYKFTSVLGVEFATEEKNKMARFALKIIDARCVIQHFRGHYLSGNMSYLSLSSFGQE